MKTAWRAPPDERPGRSPGWARAGPRTYACLTAVGLMLTLCAWSGTAYGNGVGSIGTIRADFDTVDPLDKVHVQVDLDGDFVWDIDKPLYAGVYRLWLDPKLVPGHPPGDPLGPGLPSSPDAQAIAASATPVPGGYKLGTFCCDVIQNVISGAATYDVYLIQEAPLGGGNTPMGDVKADDLRELFGQDVLTSPLMGLTDAGVAEALQACVWEIIYEDRDTYGYNLGSGNVQISSVALFDDANDWLSDIWNNDLDNEMGLRALVREDAQDFVLQIPGLGADPIPEPVTVMGMFLGLAAGAGYLRKRASDG